MDDGVGNGRPKARTFSEVIVGRIRPIQSGLLGRRGAKEVPKARARLAQLRAGVGREPGSVPEIWELTVGGLPGNYPQGDDPTPHERAAHTALTLYALHQQSRTDPMHRDKRGLGQAVRMLGNGNGKDADQGKPDREKAVRRRLDAAALATSFAEAEYHLRGLIKQLRADSIELDYGLLADDLLTLQQPGGPDTVRRRWGRQYYRPFKQIQTPEQPVAGEASDPQEDQA